VELVLQDVISREGSLVKHSDNYTSRRAAVWQSSYLIVAIVLCSFLTPIVQAQKVKPAPGTVFVKTALGGFILGYDIDQNGTEGVLAEALNLPDGNFNVAVETFDQTTGMILKIVKQQTETKNDFVALGIFGNSVGLIEFEKVKGLFVNQRLYGTLNPLTSNKVTGTWTPPLTKDQLILGMGVSQGATNTVILASQNFSSFVFSSDVASNTFGPSITLTDSIFAFNDSPVVDIDTQTNEAVVAASNGGVFSSPEVAFVDLTAGTINEIKGLGFGFVNGIAVDAVKGRAVTTTEIDFSLEYYDVAKQASILVEPLHNATNQLQSGGAVAFDPVNKLFLIGQEFSSVAPSGSSIQVFDEAGNFKEAVNGLSLPASPTRIAINPNTRMGYVIVTPALTSLQSFTY
jgi:hypothetical protein